MNLLGKVLAARQCFQATIAATQAWLAILNDLYMPNFTCAEAISVEYLPVKDNACSYPAPNFYQNEIRHVTPGLDQDVRALILRAAREARIDVVDGGIYIQTNGPRLETKAEIAMLKSFGDVVGMTMANEATLAKELDLPYASICSIDNFCHGITETPLAEEEIITTARQNVEKVKGLIHAVLEELR